MLSAPLRALCEGMAAPGLRWNAPPPIPGLKGLVSNTLLDKRGERPVGELNYALVSRDYLNLNARVDFHFAMVDAICGPNPRENSVRFRFKGGGTSRTQRERRARFVEMVMAAGEFYTSRQGDLVTALFNDGPPEVVREKLIMLGRFLGFSRLLDAAMVNDDMPGFMAAASNRGTTPWKGWPGAVAARPSLWRQRGLRVVETHLRQFYGRERAAVCRACVYANEARRHQRGLKGHMAEDQRFRGILPTQVAKAPAAKEFFKLQAARSLRAGPGGYGGMKEQIT